MSVACNYSLSSKGTRIVLMSLAMMVIAGCSREEEDALRDRLDGWFSVGETISFHATPDCAAASFRLVDMQVKSSLSVVNSAPQVPITLSRRGAVALDDPAQAPDAALVELTNANRPLGLGMRRAALEGRLCMNEEVESAFRYALDNPRTVLAYDAKNATIMLLDPRTGLLVVAMGAVEWG